MSDTSRWPAGPATPGDAPPEGTGLGRAAVGGASWESLSFVLTKLATLVATIVLARLLAPEDFGLVALALVFITYAEVITDLGVSQALIFLPPSRRSNDAALALAVLWGLLLAAAVTLGAPAVARFFEQPSITPMIRVLALSLLFGALGDVPDALLRKHLRFRRRVAATVTRAASRGGISIALAALGFGAWSIIWGYVASQAAWALAGWLLVDHRPNLRLWRLDRTVLRPLLGFGIPAAGTALLLAVIFNVDYLIVGERLGAEPLGFYTVAYRIPEMIILQALWVVSAVSFPLYSIARDDPALLRHGYLTGLRILSFYGIGTGIGIAVVAPMLVPAVFGAKWAPSVAPLQAIALYAVFATLAKSAMDLYKGIGRPGLAVGLSLLRLIVVVPALLLGATAAGIAGVAWAHAAASLMIALLLQGVAIRLIGIPWRRWAGAFVPALAAGAGIALGAGAVRLWLPGSDWLRLGVAVAAGAAAGLAAVALIDRRFIGEARSLLLSPLRERQAHRGGAAPAATPP